MIRPLEKLSESAYVVLDTLYSLGLNRYDGRIANQTILLGRSESLDEQEDAED